jgi:hypothetical protein
MVDNGWKWATEEEADEEFQNQLLAEWEEWWNSLPLATDRDDA